jgi:hypothetical protein
MSPGRYGSPSLQGPVIPPPPPQQPVRRARSSGAGDGRAFIWLVALALGIGAGVGCYQVLPVVYESVDEWLALFLG